MPPASAWRTVHAGHQSWPGCRQSIDAGLRGVAAGPNATQRQEPEIKYAYRRNHWGRGIATEAAVGLIRYGASAHGLCHLMATAAPDNVASHRVLLKAGMERGALRDDGDGSQTQLFHWRAARGAA